MIFPFGGLLKTQLEACPDGDLDDCIANRDSSDCEDISDGVIIALEWDYVACDDDCHYIRIHRRPINTGSCSGTYAQIATGKSCDLADCTPAGGYDGCYEDEPGWEYDNVQQTRYFCYKVEVRKDIDDSLDDSVECVESFPAKDCFEF